MFPAVFEPAIPASKRPLTHAATETSLKHSFIVLKHIVFFLFIFILCVTMNHTGIAVAQRLRCCATSRKVVGSIPGGVIGIFH